jgi:hypothetical protein
MIVKSKPNRHYIDDRKLPVRVYIWFVSYFFLPRNIYISTYNPCYTKYDLSNLIGLRV